MKEIPMAAGQQGRFTIGLAVANNEAAISHASTLIARAASEPEIRIIVHTDIDAVRDQLMHDRETSLPEAGREPNFSDSSAATPEFGGCSFPDNGGDHLIGNVSQYAPFFGETSNKLM